MSMSKSAGFLPEEMMTEIFIRLPVKSLLRCKSVCKPWLSTISTSNFIKSHLRQALIASRNNPTFLELRPPRGTEDDLNIENLSTSHIRIRRIIFDAFEFCRISSCCNGILCVADYSNDVYLWNLSLRQRKKLPCSKPYPDRAFMEELLFGYDSISDDYIVVKVLYRFNSEGTETIFQVYSSNADSWTTEFQPPIGEGGLLVSREKNLINGVLYSIFGDNVASFDLHKHTLVLVPFPTSYKTRNSCVLDFEGSVAIAFGSGSGVDLWTLHDDESGEVSWTKRFRIQGDSNLDIWLDFYLGARQFYGNKFVNDKYLCSFLYDYEKKQTRYYQHGEDSIVLNYTGTLVSFDGFEQVESLDGFELLDLNDD